MKDITICFCIALTIVVIGCGSQDTYAQDDPPIRVNTVLLNVPIIVSDRSGRAVEGLRAADFRVFSGEREQAVEFFSSSEMTLNVAILIDVTGSVTSVFNNIKKAAREFVDKLGPNDRGMLVTFGDEIKVLQDLTSDKKKLQNRISGAEKVAGGGALMDAAVLSVLRGSLAKIDGRKAIMVITDAGEINSYITPALMRELIESDTVVFPIYFPTATSWFPRGKQPTLADLIKTTPVGRLNDFANATGGSLLVSSDNEFGPQFKEVMDQLKRMYLIGFYPDSRTDAPNKLTITVNRESVSVRSKSVIRAKSTKNVP